MVHVACVLCEIFCPVSTLNNSFYQISTIDLKKMSKQWIGGDKVVNSICYKSQADYQN